MNYQNNKAAAIESDDRDSYINKSGALDGVFTMARSITASTGTKGVEFTFKSNDGATANRLSLYTENSKGESIFGYKQLCGIMTVLGVDGIVGEQATIKIYDYDQRSEVDTISTIYPALINKPIGVIFQSEEYYKNDQTIGKKVNMWGFYRVSDRATVLEVGKGIQSDGSRLADMIDGLKDKTIKPATPVQGAVAQDQGQYAGQTPPQHNFDEDLTF